MLPGPRCGLIAHVPMSHPRGGGDGDTPPPVAQATILFKYVACGVVVLALASKRPRHGRLPGVRSVGRAPHNCRRPVVPAVAGPAPPRDAAVAVSFRSSCPALPLTPACPVLRVHSGGDFDGAISVLERAARAVRARRRARLACGRGSL